MNLTQVKQLRLPGSDSARPGGGGLGLGAIVGLPVTEPDSRSTVNGNLLPGLPPSSCCQGSLRARRRAPISKSGPGPGDTQAGKI